MNATLIKKMSTSQIFSKLEKGSFDVELTQVAIEVLKGRKQDVSKYETKVEEPEVEETPEVEEKEELPYEVEDHSGNTITEETAGLITSKIEGDELEKLPEDLAAQAVEILSKVGSLYELTEEDGQKILSLFKPKVEKKKGVRTKATVVLNERQKEIIALDLTKAERIRRLFDTGLLVKQIANATGWDYVTVYDAVKIYKEKKK